MLLACGDDDHSSGGGAGADGGSEPDAAAPTAGSDAGRDDASTVPIPDATVPFIPDRVVCALAVGAECDGPEDCASGSTCCAQFSLATYSYTQIACSETCDATDQYELCHPQSSEDAPRPCQAQGDVCRRSVIVPHDFITVCVPRLLPSQFVPSDTSHSVEVAGEVACGAQRCAAGAEHCCLRNEFDFETMMSTPLEPFCAPAGSTCSCDMQAPVRPPVDLDGGQEDGG